MTDRTPVDRQIVWTDPRQQQATNEIDRTRVPRQQLCDLTRQADRRYEPAQEIAAADRALFERITVRAAGARL